MEKADIKLLLKIALGILLVILAVRFFIAILPIIIIALLGLLIYDSLKKYKKKPVNEKKDNGIKEAEILSERNID